MKHKRKKITKYRGSKTHGGGSMKKRRGAGNRGGRGKAGSGKRADTKKPTLVNQVGNMKNYFGNNGFVSRFKKNNSINITDVNVQLKSLIIEGFATGDKGKYKVDLRKAGYDKLLGSGVPENVYEIEVDSASAKAVEKIAEKGGKVNVKSAKAETETELNGE